jgi:CBS domain-containing protein
MGEHCPARRRHRGRECTHVAELKETDVAVVHEDASISDAVLHLADAHVHGVPVVNRRGRALGVLSSSDIVQATAEQSDTARQTVLEDTSVRDIMSTPPRTICPEDDVRVAAREMERHDVHRLFVISGEELVGVLPTSDIVRAVADDLL